MGCRVIDKNGSVQLYEALASPYDLLGVNADASNYIVISMRLIYE
jgi:hypothetical protein